MIGQNLAQGGKSFQPNESGGNLGETGRIRAGNSSYLVLSGTINIHPGIFSQFNEFMHAALVYFESRGENYTCQVL